MTVQELIKKLRAADPKSDVQVCVGADYYAIDEEFTSTTPLGSGECVFVIDTQGAAPSEPPPGKPRAATCEQIHVVPGEDGQGLEGAPCGKPARWLLGEEPICDRCRAEYLANPEWTEEDFKPIAEAHAH